MAKYLMEKQIKAWAHDIAQIIEDCEWVQRSKESDFSKEQEMIIAYQKIVGIAR